MYTSDIYVYPIRGHFTIFGGYSSNLVLWQGLDAPK